MSFFRKNKKKHVPKTLEMILDHDGSNWILRDGSFRVAAPSLDELDRKVEQALAGELRRERSLRIFMTSNNEVIPKWMRPYMNHYFNRILELPLQYQV